MRVTRKRIEIPDKCGNFCPNFRYYGYEFPMQYQGDDCYRCPIMNCSKDEDGICLLEPEHYREELLETFLEWWDEF